MDWQNPETIAQVTRFLRSRVEEISRRSISSQQTESLKKAAVNLPTVVAKFSIRKPPEDDLRRCLFRVIEVLDEGDGKYLKPESCSINAEWTGNCEGVGSAGFGDGVTERGEYEVLMKGVRSPVVVFFIYGGAYYLNSPSSYTRIVSKLAKMTGGHCLTIHQRLAPQNPFPAALLDVLTAYISLIFPPPGSFHKPIPASSIIIAGDSSGGGLALALLQVLLTIKRQNWTFKYHGRNADLALPAGVTLLSASADYTVSMPSHKLNAKFDVFGNVPGSLRPVFPSCDLWPTIPPRDCIYCEGSMARHPLVSPIAARDWSGSPPLWFACGQEQMVDGVKVVAQNAYKQGVDVVFKEYEMMPHLFMVFYTSSPQYARCWEEWAEVCRSVVGGKGVVSRAVFVEVKGLKERELDGGDLIGLSGENVRELMRRGNERVVDGKALL